MSENINEVTDSQLPFAEMLSKLGYQYISKKEALAERGGKESRFILKEIAFKKLMQINEYEIGSQKHKFEASKIYSAIDELDTYKFDGLISTSEKIYHLLMSREGGKTIEVSMNGKKTSKNFKFIDFYNIENNDFHFTLEYSVKGKQTIRIDIVCFINGIPFVLIENKKETVNIQGAINQMCRNQKTDYVPELYSLAQLFIVSNRSTLLYGTTGSKKDFYVSWIEKDKTEIEIEKTTKDILRKKIDETEYLKIVSDLPNTSKKEYKNIERKPTEQDKTIACLFPKQRIMDLVKNHILFDGGNKKVSRYQQYFAVQKVLQTVKKIEKDSRKGGIIWHTQGSGKSLTMVLIVKALIEDPNINNPRIILVTDRTDLEDQIRSTFHNCNIKKDVYRAESSKDLIQKIKEKDLRVISTLIHKFQDSNNLNADFEDADKNIFVLIDEAHRSHGGMTNIKMQKVIPNACYIAFTGTPLMKSEKGSVDKFGTFIDTYTITDALKDKVILPLIYEPRYVALEFNTKHLDRDHERLKEDLKEKNPNLSDFEIQKIDNQETQKQIKANPSRIEEIARNIEEHFIHSFHNTGLKGQIVASSKYAAVLYQEYFEAKGKIKTALVMSDEIDDGDTNNTNKKKVIEYLENLKHEKGDLSVYEKGIIDNFKNKIDGIEIIIVVSKLLTGFDAPRNTVLYLDKVLVDHNLLQAIARVNRLFDNKEKKETIKNEPKNVGYIIDYSENAHNLKDAMILFSNFDTTDIQDTIINSDDKINEMLDIYNNLVNLFKDINNKEDKEEYIAKINNPGIKIHFDSQVSQLVRCLHECYYLPSFVTKCKNINDIQKELKNWLEIKKTIDFRFADNTDDLSFYKESLKKILAKHINAEEVELLSQPIDLSDIKVFEKELEKIGSNKGKAEAIANQMNKVIELKLEEDPEYFQSLSDKIQDILEKMKTSKIEAVEALLQLKQLHFDFENNTDDTVPSIIQFEIDKIYYRNLKKYLDTQNDERYEEIICHLGKLITENAIVEWHTNFQVQKKIKNRISDFLDELEKEGVRIHNQKKLIDEIIELSKKNHEIISKRN